MTKNLIGKLCVKTCGRESGRKCVIVSEIDDHFVLIDGNVKRRRCNINHIEILSPVLKLKQGASTQEVKKAMEDIGIETRTPRKKEKPAAEKPVKKRKEKKIKEEKKPKKKDQQKQEIQSKPKTQSRSREELKENKKEQAQEKSLVKAENKATGEEQNKGESKKVKGQAKK
ncbi:MAG: 50S ribosomal protein L14e [Nanoarchaeota archaeon]|nr:50S ribosomal protein L14e [Nanoarchaeota archaeon]